MIHFVRLALSAALLGLVGTNSPTSVHADAPQIRAEFVLRFQKVKPGMPASQVREILGAPDVVQTSDTTKLERLRATQIWLYGADKSQTFGTLGTVVIGHKGEVTRTAGNDGQPLDVKLVPEEELRKLLSNIHSVGPIVGSSFNPQNMIEAVNSLMPLGKEVSCDVLREYLRVTNESIHLEREGVLLILRVLFDPPQEPGYMPMLLGKPFPDIGKTESNFKAFPRFPIWIKQDMPVLLTVGYAFLGNKPETAPYVDYFQQHMELRTRGLAPPDKPLQVLPALLASPAGRLHSPKWQNGYTMLAGQLLRMAGESEEELELRMKRVHSEQDFTQEWAMYVEQLSKKDTDKSSQPGKPSP
jgi:hypothetical protein